MTGPWTKRSLRNPDSGRLEARTDLDGPLRPRLDGAVGAGFPRFRGAPEVVLRQGAEAAVRQVDLLGEVRLLRRVLGRRHQGPRAS